MEIWKRLYLVVLACAVICSVARDCYWDQGNSTYDLAPLMIDTSTAGNAYSYDQSMYSGYNYVFNICDELPSSAYPSICDLGESGSAIQYSQRAQACYVIGSYIPNKINSFKLLDDSDPSQGVSVIYFDGDYCSDKTRRYTQIDVYCSRNVYMEVVSVSEPITCFYKINVESYYGYPEDCILTSNGICNNSGECRYDSNNGKAYCECDIGYSGDDCSELDGDASEDDNFTITDAFEYIYVYQHNLSWFYYIIGLVVVLNLNILLCYCIFKRKIKALFGNRFNRAQPYYEVSQNDVIIEDSSDIELNREMRQEIKAYGTSDKDVIIAKVII